jgi:hypothetical protein
VNPSTPCDEYPNATFGAGPPRLGGNVTGYDQLKSPELPPAVQLSAGFRSVAL